MNLDEYLKILTKLYREKCMETSEFQEMMLGKDIETSLTVLGDVEITMRDGKECVELTEKAREVIEELMGGKA